MMLTELIRDIRKRDKDNKWLPFLLVIQVALPTFLLT